MNKINIYEASKIMWNAIKNEELIDSLPKKLIPKSKKEAYEIQKTYKSFTDFEHIGYKIAATSVDGQIHINVSGPILGMLFKHNVYSNNDTINFTNNTMGVAEAEIAFKLSKNIYSHLKISNSKENITLYPIYPKKLKGTGVFLLSKTRKVNKNVISKDGIKTEEYKDLVM